jgi:hypothetical protein
MSKPSLFRILLAFLCAVQFICWILTLARTFAPAATMSVTSRIAATTRSFFNGASGEILGSPWSHTVLLRLGGT